MRIGIFTDTYTPDINGVVSSIVTLQKELERNGHDVFIITNHKAMTMKKEGNVLRLPGLELKWLYGYKLSTPYHFSARDEIRDMHLDVIHVHTEFGVGIFGRIVAKHLHIPLVSTYHTMYEDYTHYVNRFSIDEVDKVSKKVVSSFSRFVSDNAQAVIAPSEKTKETLLKYGVKRPVYVIPTGLNFDKFDINHVQRDRVAQIRAQYHIQPEDKVIVFVGRIAKEKSIEIPLVGMKYVKDSRIKLMIVGGGPQLEELKALAKQEGVEERVVFTDKQTRDEVPNYYACADCFVSASLTETQGMTYIEALACGLPVFARYDDVLKDLVIENESGYLFKDEKEYAQKLDAFFQLSDEQRDVMRQKAHDKIVKYDSKVFYSKVLSVYYQAIDDYEEAYEVIKIKTYDDYVRIYAINEKDDEPLKIMIDYDRYFAYKIQLHTMLDRHSVEEFQYAEIVLNAYRQAIRKLRMKDYTRKEMLQFFQRQEDLPTQAIEGLLKDLEAKGYINDIRYIHQKIEKMHYALMGKNYIRNALVNKGLPLEEIEEVLDAYDDEEEAKKALKMAEKLKTSVNDKSSKMKVQTIIRKLISLGFESSVATRAVDYLEFEKEDDSDALRKTLAKAYRTYHRRFQSKQLLDKMVIYCLQKGFERSAVMEEIAEMEWNDDEKGE